ncbi:MAG TPA: 50S ribosomal protein L25 [Clostridia bacterium]|jgi:large subunit ribosomal protein L25|nr:50S ribosomal protein L25 [Clostridia bacterium]
MMSNKLRVSKRTAFGKGSAKRARRTGRVPGVFYGGEVGNLAIEAEEKELQKVIGKQGLIEVVVEDGKTYQGLLRDVQYHPVKNSIIHYDLFQVASNETIKVTVPLVLEGQPQGVAEGGILQHGQREIEIECLAQNIPEKIDIDISNMQIGDIYKVGDIPQLKDITIVTDPDTVIASIISKRITEVEEDAAEDGAENTAAETPSEDQESQA